ncbi:ATP-grasp domain-containing protein [Streptomyces misionensis]|uniref:ATP-grasp domain-containing protein n=1 Tax=Streptomyces misionensis TaxID=67331 RepID=UPI003685F0A5
MDAVNADGPDEDCPGNTDDVSTLVIVGANPTVARAAAALPGELVHVQLPGAPALDPGTRVLTADFRDLAAFLTFTDEVLRPLRPTAVVSLTEFGLEPAALAARLLGVTGVDPAVVHATRDKLAMRRILEREAPHLNPAFAAGDDTAAVDRLFAVHGRAVAKPVDGVGSTSIALVESADALPADRRTAATLFEQFAEGREFSVEALSAGGRHTVIGIAEKGTTDGFVEVSHMMPPPSLDPRRQELVAGAVGELLDALGLTDGPSHTEVMVDGDKVVVIETHTRLGGDGIADLVRLTTGIEWRRAALGWAIGAGVRRGPATAAAAATVFLTAPPGRVTAVAPPPALTQGRVHAWDLTVRPGDEVRPLRSSADRLGMAVLTAPGTDACAAAVAELTARPVVTTAPAPRL